MIISPADSEPVAFSDPALLQPKQDAIDAIPARAAALSHDADEATQAAAAAKAAVMPAKRAAAMAPLTVRRLGDLKLCRRWLDEAKIRYESGGLPGGSTPALIGLVWWSLAVGDLPQAERYAEQARHRASEAADPLLAILADTVVAAVTLASSATKANRARFAAVLQRRAAAGRSTAFFEGTLDDPDVAALAATHGIHHA